MTDECVVFRLSGSEGTPTGLRRLGVGEGRRNLVDNSVLK